MTIPRPLASLTAAVLVVLGLALFLVYRATAPAAPAAGARQEMAPVAATPPVAHPSPTPVPAGSCPAELRAESLPARNFDERWAMCLLFGNFDPQSRSSAAEGARVVPVLSEGFVDGRRRRHLLALMRRPEPAGARVGDLPLDLHVFSHDGSAWRLEASAPGMTDAGPGGHPPELRLLRVGPERSALLVTPAGAGPASLVGLSEGVASIAGDLPAGRDSTRDCEPIRCFSWRADLSLERRSGAYDDLVFHVHGTQPDDDERVWPVDKTTRWVFRGGRYRPE